MAFMNFAWSSAVRAEPGEPLACWLDKHARVQGGGRESPGMRVTFFCFAKRKSPKKRRPPVCDPCAALRGKPAAGRLRGAPWNSLCAARAARTATASQSTKHARCDARATPQPPRRRRSQQGWDSRTSKQPTSIRAFASLGPASAARGACAREVGPSEAKARVDVPSPLPLWMRRGAQGLADQGSRVSERRAAARVERDPAKHEHRRLPRSEAQGTQTGGRFLFGDFLLARQEKVTRMPGDSRPPPSNQACGPISAQKKTLQKQ